MSWDLGDDTTFIKGADKCYITENENKVNDYRFWTGIRKRQIMKQWEYINVRTQGSQIIGVDQPPAARYAKRREWECTPFTDFLSRLCREGWDLYGFQQSVDGKGFATFFLRRQKNGKGNCPDLDGLAGANGRI
jgi:hypothetical protein